MVRGLGVVCELWRVRRAIGRLVWRAQGYGGFAGVVVAVVARQCPRDASM